MALEAATTINQLVSTNPQGTDTKSQGDDHLRLIKGTLLNTFPNITGPVTVSHGELNALAGGRNLTFPGMIVMWAGSTAPPGWKICDGVGTLSNGFPVPDLRNRFVLGGGLYPLGSTGGSKDAIVVAHTHTGSTSSAGNHNHTIPSRPNDKGGNGYVEDANGSGVVRNTSTGSAGDHTHSFTTDSSGSSGNNANLPPYYVLAFIIKE